MKKFILLLSFYFCLLSCYAQRNSVMFSISPIDMGIGLRYDRFFSRQFPPYHTKFGTYIFAGRGNYLIDEASYCKHHTKYSAGFLFWDKESVFSLGLNYHTFRDYQNLNKRALAPFSCDIGFAGKVKRFMMGIRFDVVKIESNLDIGFNF
jgi:hypothetical protein